MKPGRAAFVGRIDPAIPDDHFARAVLPRWNHAFERGIVVRVILGLHGEALFARIERRAPGNRPGLENAFAFEAEVVVQLPGGVLLDDEQQRPARRSPAPPAAGSGVAVKVRLAEYSGCSIVFCHVGAF